eukprot:1597324-Rhodomonas_salina.2
MASTRLVCRPVCQRIQRAILGTEFAHGAARAANVHLHHTLSPLGSLPSFSTQTRRAISGTQIGGGTTRSGASLCTPPSQTASDTSRSSSSEQSPTNLSSRSRHLLNSECAHNAARPVLIKRMARSVRCNVSVPTLRPRKVCSAHLLRWARCAITCGLTCDHVRRRTVCTFTLSFQRPVTPSGAGVQVSAPISLRACYAMSGTDIAYCDIALRACYAMSHTDLAYRAISRAMRCPVLTYRMVLCIFARAIPCPVFT